jgi:predicted ATPase
VLIFDDLHWADEASLALLLSMMELVAEHRLLLVGLLRPDKTAASWSFLERARRALDGRFSEIMLEPLPTETAQELLGNLLYIEDLPQGICELILKKSEGNPFFLEEVIRSLIDAGHIVQENNHWRAMREIVNVTIPDTLAGVLSARIDRLLEETKRVAQTAAVIGRIFTYRVLDKVCTEAPLQEQIVPVEPHLQTLTYEELIRERTREPEIEYIFKHTLTQEAAYELLLIKRRKELHRRVGSVLEELYTERLDELAPTLALHFWHGEEWARAAEYAMRAGTQAMNVYALREALEHYQRAYEALEKVPNAPREALVDAILGWTPAALKYRAHADVLNRLKRAEQIARELNDKRRLALTLHWIAHLYLNAGFPSRAIEPLLENYQLASELGDERLSVYPSWYMAFSLVASDPRSALAQLEHVIELAGKHNHKGIQAHALATKAMAHARLGEFAQANAEIQRALAVVRSIDAPVMQADVDLLSSLACFDMGDRERGLEYSRRGTEKSLATNAMECVAAGYYIMGVANLETRSMAEALAAFEESIKFLPEFADDKELAIQIRAGLAIAQFLSGRIAAIKDIESALANAQVLGDLYTAAFISKALGESYMQLDEFERAEQYLSGALDYYRRNDMRPYLARTLQSLADLYEKQGRNTDAEDARAEARVLMEALQAPPAGEESFTLDVDGLQPARPASG